MSGSDWAFFFYPVQRRLMADAESASQTPRRGALLCRPNHRFLEILGFSARFENSPETAVFAFILGIA